MTVLLKTESKTELLWKMGLSSQAISDIELLRACPKFISVEDLFRILRPNNSLRSLIIYIYKTSKVKPPPPSNVEIKSNLAKILEQLPPELR